ncbi:hypothetical protein FN846DRAFT_889396 [Sphaerosporella brunnea]|uniref:Zn(2)-C6 fungal-type domain-containing protein n=1 Tax=Sphaerosporella brunnea TaxID=1250544 RepID=A0A5J5F000_9PEZI|nr:hypothetical protein FN846DRAFT_889396 [Sphaerosporella brunnea]
MVDLKATTAGANAIRTIDASRAQNQEQRRHRQDPDSGQTPLPPNSVDVGLEPPDVSYQIASSPPFPTTTVSPHELLPHSLASTNEENQEIVPGVPLPPYSQYLQQQQRQQQQPNQLQPRFSTEDWLSEDHSPPGVEIDCQYQEQHEFGSRSSPVSPPASSTSQCQHPAQTPSISLNTAGPSLSNPGPSTWRRRLTKTRSLTTMAGSVKCSISTSNVKQAAAAAMLDPPYLTDKRRNKLGYHRISVACVHCRRRKIRCLLQKDAQGRCSNCIRLKKECKFNPVDCTARRSRSMSKPDINSAQEPTSESSSPSPPGVNGHLQQSTEPPRGYASVPVTPTYDFPGSFDDSFCAHNKLSSSGGQLAVSRSTNVSRKSSLAQMHSAAPLASKMEQGGFLSARPQWPSHSESTTPISDGFGGLGAPLQRLDSFPFDPSLGFVGSMDPLQDEDACYSQASSRMGSIDHSAIYPHFPPALVSASGSTTSLTASISEPSQYGDGPSGSGAFFAQSWDRVALGLDPASYESESPLSKQASFESTSSWPDENMYSLSFSAPLEMPM